MGITKIKATYCAVFVENYLLKTILFLGVEKHEKTIHNQLVYTHFFIGL
jgi:hypothetical protein